jgi:DNA-binding response OmpR family regulator
MIILNVDDDLDDQEIFAEAVRQIDPLIECLAASNAEDAQRMLSVEPALNPDYIFLDMNMPKMNGMELLVLIKNDKALSQIPIWILSTSCSEKDVDKIRSAGAMYIQKQSEFQKTVAALTSILHPAAVRSNSDILS